MMFMKCDRCGYVIDSAENRRKDTARKVTKMQFAPAKTHLDLKNFEPKALITKDLCSTCVRMVIRIMNEKLEEEKIENG